MSILLYHEIDEDARVALSEGIIGGQRTPERHYQGKGHFLEIDPPANAREHDVGELGKLGWRQATFEEQNAYAKQQKRAGSITEVSLPAIAKQDEQARPPDHTSDHTKKK
ncbi:MAG TPA: hypothetical protein VHV10_02355 [Ktedonobacteraceae bacterium]|jgi:hypothetical protein|nr:hypothetical protein [Ktedonobacteraceae bacterium]